MPRYKLVYFDVRGRAEISRYLFAYSGIKYEDHRIKLEDWAKIKPTIPFGKIPILEVDGVIIHQSLAIGRYLAKETGLAGQTPLEQALADAIVDTIDDFVSMFPWAEKNPDVKQQIYNDLLTNTAPGLLQDLDNFLGDKKWLVGKSVTWADFYWDVCSTTFLVLRPGLVDNYPKLLALKERVQALPAIAAWIEQRPKTTL
ncbi:hematopoietic prostaglandin D synthase [Pelodiscus sinensis]|uniref:glutathione transferase n=1 Tax=Pelodiscus sinensis TaxID=13735 RepID=K7FQ40_PELSI|nr:hematopoietic prostaglandin D synthase [Pelodiscus sinensis]|eukprot:XP_006112012.1 hematopoietic prostaglandin D synthase [Pelodiscus sinensis]